MEKSKALEWTPTLVKEFWQHYAENRQEDYFTNLFGKRIMEVTKKYYAKDVTVCDYGYGSGFLLAHILKTHRAAGCDFTPQNLEVTRQRVSHMAKFAEVFTVDDAIKGGKQFDVLYVVETIEHVLENDMDAFFKALHNLLKPGGTIILTTPNAEDLQASTVFCPCCKHTFHRWQHVRNFSQSSMSAFMSKRGFEPVRTFATDFSAKSPWQKFKTALRPIFGKYNPHLVFVGLKV